MRALLVVALVPLTAMLGACSLEDLNGLTGGEAAKDASGDVAEDGSKGLDGASTADVSEEQGYGADVADEDAGEDAAQDGSRVSCPSGFTPCGGICVDTSTDNGNCGSCGTACSSSLSSFCSSGSCAFNCGGTLYAMSTVANGTYELTDYAGFVLDDPSGGGAGTGVDQWAYEGTNQQWTVTNVGGGQYEILAQNGLALTGEGGGGAQVQLQTYTGANTQLYSFVRNGAYYNIINVASCDEVDDTGGGISTAVSEWSYPRGNNNGMWTLTSVASVTAPIANGTYEIETASGYALDDVSGGGSGTVPDESTYAGTNQQWTVTLVKGVLYKIISASGAVLTESATSNTTIAPLSAYTGSSDQLWVFWPTGSGAYWLVNVGTGMALDDNGGGGMGVNPQQWRWNAPNGHQEWTVTAK